MGARMTFERENIGYFIAFMLIGGILGSALGTLIAKLAPAASIVKADLTGAIGVNLEIVSFSIKLNIAAIVGIVAGIAIFRKL